MKNRSLLFSLLLHIIFSFIFYHFKDFHSSRVVHRPNVNLKNIPRKIYVVKMEKKKKEEIRPEKKMQIVNSKEMEKLDELNKKAKFLGKINNKVEKETKAAQIGSFQIKQEKKQEIKPEVKEETKIKKLPKPLLDLKNLALKLAPLQPPAIKPQKQGQDAQAQISQNNDYIEDIPVGDISALNTQEFKFFGFYDRIRKSLETHWGVSLREKAKKLFGKGKMLASNENYITSLQIKLDTKGNIISVSVVGSSGQEDLDHAAIESFNKAGPFPNPPSELVQNGHAVLEWGFVVKT